MDGLFYQERVIGKLGYPQLFLQTSVVNRLVILWDKDTTKKWNTEE